MKNIHILLTDKPSRLIFNSFHKSFCYQKEIDGMYINDGKVNGADFWGLQKALNNGFKPQNIYITSDEEIKEGDLFIGIQNQISRATNKDIYGGFEKKIILTTDQDLINDGIQTIDDEFLEWFVKNPNCEEVEVHKYHQRGDVTFKDLYEIIIPKEEPKQTDEKGRPMTYWGGLEEPKQETLEEAGEKLYPNRESFLHRFQNIERKAFTEGAEWQAERMYSEEDMTNYALYILHNNVITPKEWFNKVKKK